MSIGKVRALVLIKQEDLDKAGLCKLFECEGGNPIASEPTIINVETKITRKKYRFLTSRGLVLVAKIVNTGIAAGVFTSGKWIAITFKQKNGWSDLSVALVPNKRVKTYKTTSRNNTPQRAGALRHSEGR